MKNVFKILGNVMVVVLMILLVALVFFTISSKKNKDGIPKLGGYQLLVVLSGSMRPVFNEGDVIIVQAVAVSGIKKGAIITFKDPEDSNRIVTHRVIDIQKHKGLVFKTKGDANNTADRLAVPAGNIIGQMKFKIPYMGKGVEFAKTKKGLVWLIIVPGTLVILSEVRHLAKILADTERKKQEGAREQPWSNE